MKLSIITINRNNIDGLRQTFDSIFSQTSQDFEYIVIDGASDDGSADLIRQNHEKIHYFVSEKDTGIYNAMNKGIRQAHGDYCLFMNSGDCLFDQNVVKDILPELDDQAAFVTGLSVGTTGKIHRFRSDSKFRNFWGASLPHQATFIRTSLLIELGGYHENYRSCSDMLFFFEAIYLRHQSVKIIDRKISLTEALNGISATTMIGVDERRDYIVRSMPFFWKLRAGFWEIYEIVRRKVRRWRKN